MSFSKQFSIGKRNEMKNRQTNHIHIQIDEFVHCGNQNANRPIEMKWMREQKKKKTTHFVISYALFFCAFTKAYIRATKLVQIDKRSDRNDKIEWETDTKN